MENEQAGMDIISRGRREHSNMTSRTARHHPSAIAIHSSSIPSLSLDELVDGWENDMLVR